MNNLDYGEPFFTKVAQGLIPGYELGYKYGLNRAIARGTDEDVWRRGGDYSGFVSAYESVVIKSSDANDTTNGTGARVVCVKGLDQNFDEIEADVELNGVTNVEVVDDQGDPILFSRINRAFVRTSGSSGGNIGQLAVHQSTSTSNVFLTIEPEVNQTEIAAFTVPRNKTLYFKRLFASLSRTDGSGGAHAQISMMIRLVGSNTFRPIIRYLITEEVLLDHDLQPGGLRVPSMSDIKVRAGRVYGNRLDQGATVEVSTAFDYYMRRNDV